MTERSIEPEVGFCDECDRYMVVYDVMGDLLCIDCMESGEDDEESP